jgi:hypothetical protein
MSLAAPIGAGSALPGIGGDYEGFASSSFGYSRIGANGSFAITYQPEYVRRVRYPGLSAFNEQLNLNATRRLNAQWSMYLTGTAGEATIDSFLFNPGGLGDVASAPGDLSAGLSSGTAALGPTSLLVFGNRVFTSSAAAGLNYKPTTRFTLNFQALTALQIYRPDSEEPVNALIPRNFQVGGSLTLNYSINPRTQFGVKAVTTRTVSAYGEYQNTIMEAYIDRTLSEHWFGSIAGGPAFTNYLSGTLAANVKGTALSYAANASLGYRNRNNTVLMTAGRNAGDAYGLGSSTTESFGAAWDYRRLSSAWAFKASGGKDRFVGGAFPGLNTAHAGGSIIRALNRQMYLSLEYNYVNYSGAATAGLDAHVARLSFNWIPFLRDIPILEGTQTVPADVPAATTPATKTP